MFQLDQNSYFQQPKETNKTMLTTLPIHSYIGHYEDRFYKGVGLGKEICRIYTAK